MKKLIFGIAIVAASFISFNATAAGQEPQTCKSSTECALKEGGKACKYEACPETACKGGDACSAKKDGQKKQGKKGGHKGGKVAKTDMAFKNIQLSDEQKARIETLKTQRRLDRDAAKAKMAERKEADKEARKAEHKAQQEKFDAEVKNILTPEQYKQYEANRAEAKTKRAEAKSKKADGKDGKGMHKNKNKKGHRGGDRKGAGKAETRA